MDNHGADRKAEDIYFGDSETVDKGANTFRHLCKGAGNFSARTPDAGIVEEDNFTVLCKPVRHRGIPTIHIAENGRDKDDWDGLPFTESAARKTNAASFYKLGWDGVPGEAAPIVVLVVLDR